MSPLPCSQERPSLMGSSVPWWQFARVRIHSLRKLPTWLCLIEKAAAAMSYWMKTCSKARFPPRLTLLTVSTQNKWGSWEERWREQLQGRWEALPPGSGGGFGCWTLLTPVSTRLSDSHLLVLFFYTVRKESVSISTKESCSPSAVLGAAECPPGFLSLPQPVNALFSPFVGAKSKLHWLSLAFSCSQHNFQLNCSHGCLHASAHKTRDIELPPCVAFPPVPRSNPFLCRSYRTLVLGKPMSHHHIFLFPEKLVYKKWISIHQVYSVKLPATQTSHLHFLCPLQAAAQWAEPFPPE